GRAAPRRRPGAGKRSARRLHVLHQRRQGTRSGGGGRDDLGTRGAGVVSAAAKAKGPARVRVQGLSALGPVRYAPRLRPNRNVAMARMMKTTNRILAIPAAPAAMPPKPNSAAIRAITKNTRA